MKQLTWKAEVEFNGTVEEFNAFAETMNKFDGNIKVVLPIPWPRPIPFPGIWPLEYWINKLDIRKRFAKEALYEIRLIKDIYGGIRTPHLHLDNQVMLLNQDVFKEFLGDIARNMMVTRVERAVDYVDAMQTLELLDDSEMPFT